MARRGSNALEWQHQEWDSTCAEAEAAANDYRQPHKEVNREAEAPDHRHGQEVHREEADVPGNVHQQQRQREVNREANHYRVEHEELNENCIDRPTLKLLLKLLWRFLMFIGCCLGLLTIKLLVRISVVVGCYVSLFSR